MIRQESDYKKKQFFANVFYTLARKRFDWSTTNAGYRVKMASVIVYLNALSKYYRNAAGFRGLEKKKKTVAL